MGSDFLSIQSGGRRLVFRVAPALNDSASTHATYTSWKQCGEKKPPTPRLIVAALNIWKKHRLHAYGPLHGVCRIFLDYRKNISERSEEHKCCCKIPFVAVSSDTLETWQMLPPAPHKRFRKKSFQRCGTDRDWTLVGNKIHGVGRCPRETGLTAGR